MSTDTGAASTRIQIIDGLRGLAVILMCIHHFLFDCVTLLNAPETWFSNPVFDFLHYIFAGCFILLCGVSSRFSRSNIRRGLKTLGCAAVITIVTVLIDMGILFGVLHLLAVCMLLYGLCEKLLKRIPWPMFAAVCAVMVPISNYLLHNVAVTAEAPWGYFFWVLGWNRWLVASADYFPLLPWVFVFLTGTALGEPIKNRALPQWFYTARIPVLPAVGRKALWIYMAHQPVIYGLVLALSYII